MDQDEVRDGKPGVDENRRKLIKAAAVAGGAAVAVGALPGEWKKPLATVGGLPAHAQTSDAPITIPDESLVIETSFVDARSVARLAPPPYHAEFSYIDPLCEIDDTATLWAKVGPCNEVRFDNVPLSSVPGLDRVGTACEGKISFGFAPCFVENSSFGGNGSLAVQLSKGTRHSNIVNGSFVSVVYT